MKNLFLHIGFPKTGTTALQNGLFYPLHNEEQLHFLGRSTKPMFFGEFESRELFNKKYGANHPQLFEATSSDAWQHLSLDPNETYLISDENYTFPRTFLHKKNASFDSKDYLFSYLDFLNTADTRLKIILSIRNQSDILYSLFVHWYGYLFENNKDLSIEKYILQYLKNHEAQRELDYALWIRELRQLLGDENVMAYCFEEMNIDQKSVLDRLLEFVSIKDEIKWSKGLGTYNEKKTTSSGYISRPFAKHRRLSQFAKSVLNPDSPFYKFAAGTVKNIFPSTMRQVEVPKFSDNFKEDIMNYYYQNNQELLKYDFKQSYLKDFGYLR